MEHAMVLDGFPVEEKAPWLGQLARLEFVEERWGDLFRLRGREIGSVKRVTVAGTRERARVRPVHVHQVPRHIAHGERGVEAVANAREDGGLAAQRPKQPVKVGPG